ncbi:hypothetical protein D3C76_407020 [compost metagenome]
MKRILMNEVDESGAAGEAAPKGAAIRPDLTNYQTAKSATGSSTKICGDAVSIALVGATLDETYAFVADVVGITEDVLRDKYSASNVGQQRMFLGNLIRGGMASKDATKAARIETAFSEKVADFRVALDERLAQAATAREAEKAAKAEAAQKVKDDLKAEREAKAAEAKAKRETAAAEKAAAKPAKPEKAPKAPKEPAQPE